MTSTTAISLPRFLPLRSFLDYWVGEEGIELRQEPSFGRGFGPKLSRYHKLTIGKFGQVQSGIRKKPTLGQSSVTRDMREFPVCADESICEAEVLHGQHCVPESSLPRHFIGSIWPLKANLLLRNGFDQVLINQLVYPQQPVGQTSSTQGKREQGPIEGTYSLQRAGKFFLSYLMKYATVTHSGASKIYFQLLPRHPCRVNSCCVTLIYCGQHNECASPKGKYAPHKSLIVFHPAKHHEVSPPANEAVEPIHLPVRSYMPFNYEGYEHDSYSQPEITKPILPSHHYNAPNIWNGAQWSDSVKEVA